MVYRAQAIEASQTLTMSSLEMVSYINSTRKPDTPLLPHNDFMKKVPKVLGEDGRKFFGSSFYQGNGSAQLSRLIYNFPKREAMLMAMSYSYELQAQVFDAWEEGIKNGYLSLGYITPWTVI